jgi:hypothetical protein
MLATDQVDELICLLATWDRQTLTHHFQNFDSKFPVDFTSEYLSQVSVDRLRHLFLAMCLQNQKLPYDAMAAA